MSPREEGSPMLGSSRRVLAQLLPGAAFPLEHRLSCLSPARDHCRSSRSCRQCGRQHDSSRPTWWPRIVQNMTASTSMTAERERESLKAHALNHKRVISDEDSDFHVGHKSASCDSATGPRNDLLMSVREKTWLADSRYRQQQKEGPPPKNITRPTEHQNR